MPQVTIYLDDEAASMARGAAREAGSSLSAWISSMIKARVATAWPAEFVALAGAWPEDALPEARQGLTALGHDTPRETL